MSFKQIVADPDKFSFNETAFELLMQKRIVRILLICSSYDAYMLEEDGRIDEQIFNEYVALNLRQPPTFIHTDSAKKAFQILETERIDLVIEMLSIPDIEPFELAHKIKSRYPSIPIVMLTHFSREISLRLRNEDLGGLDYIFYWLGNADLLVAIVKLLEDKMNAQNDIQNIGVQAILLVEDSIRFTSTYLPDLYKVIFRQSQEFMKEALNSHQRRLRMRGRPKVLLATTYEEAVLLYNTFKHNMLGIISDISIKESNQKPNEIEGGIKLYHFVRKEDPFLPIIFQSSDIEKEKITRGFNSGFIYKYSKTLSTDLKKYIVSNFGFGDFIFRNPDNMLEIGRASDLKSFQYHINTIPDSSLVYHSSRNEISKWLNARSLFPIAQLFKQLRLDDFKTLSEARDYIYKTIGNYRFNRARGVITKFTPENYDEYIIFSRIGKGSVGGKARGLVFMSGLLKKYRIYSAFPDIRISVPSCVLITTDVFEEFIEMNNLIKIALSNAPDDEILKQFISAKLPAKLQNNLQLLSKQITKPMAVRSSSKLEDSQYQPFAGIYSTYMIPTGVSDPVQNFKFLSDAIKSVYASVFYKNSKAYMNVTSNIIDDEKMGIILQEVCGNHYGDRFYPTLSGVARSINFYPIGHEKSYDGIINLGFGLGKYVVDGGISLRFSPKYPRNILQLSSPDMALRGTQKFFYALDLSNPGFTPSIDDGANLLKLKIEEAANDKVLQLVASTYDLENNVIRDGVDLPGKKLITFSNILQHNTFPLAEIIDSMIEISQQEMGNPVEIEFAANIDVPAGQPKIFNFLQIRPIVLNDQRINFKTDNVPQDETILSSRQALGNGSIDDLYDVVYVKPDTFKPSETKRIASKLEQLNATFITGKRNYILIGPGRWGSSDPWLGVPIKWPQISEARLIVEAGLQNYRIDPSQGTHFFQNLTTFHVGYFTINPHLQDGFYDIDFLSKQASVYDDDLIRHIRFNNSLHVYIDGRKNVGVVLKPGIKL